MSVSMFKSRTRVRATNSVPHRGSSFRETLERHKLSCCFRSMGSVETLKPCSAPIASEARAISAESVARNTWPRNWWAFISAKAYCSGVAEHRRMRWPRFGAPQLCKAESTAFWVVLDVFVVCVDLLVDVLTQMV